MQETQFMSPERANAIYDILATHCGASEGNRDDLTFWFQREPNEYRFGGSLGFGGKVYIDHNGRCRVSCYPEGETEERMNAIRAANELLELLPQP